jgi:hypothetical protein
VAPRAVILTSAVVLAAAAAPTLALAEEAASANDGAVVESVADGAEDEGGLGLSLTLTYATAYVFRGTNVFQTSSQMDQRGLLAPGIAWSIFDTGLSIGYWGAFQLYGENRRALIDGALGHEQDLYLSYDFEIIGEALTGAASLYWYFYPFADPAVTGSRLPSYLEPILSITGSWLVDVTLELTYMHQVGSRWWVFYVHPSISKELELHPMVSLGLTFGFGYKVFNDPLASRDNVWDVALDVALTISPLDWFYVTPAVHAGWTNFEERSFEDEYIIWGSLDVGAEL